VRGDKLKAQYLDRFCTQLGYKFVEVRGVGSVGTCWHIRTCSAYACVSGAGGGIRPKLIWSINQSMNRSMIDLADPTYFD